MVRMGQPYLLAQQLAWDALPSAEAGL
jgi:hypothetical protein